MDGPATGLQSTEEAIVASVSSFSEALAQERGRCSVFRSAKHRVLRRTLAVQVEQQAGMELFAYCMARLAERSMVGVIHFLSGR
jgi:hypothetical protein